MERELFKRRLWDACLYPNALEFSPGGDLAVIVALTCYAYIPTLDTKDPWSMKWLRIFPDKIKFQRNWISSNISSLQDMNIWLNSRSKHSLTFSSVKWSPFLGEYSLLSVLLSDGALIILRITEDRVYESEISSMSLNMTFGVHVNGMEVFCHLNKEFDLPSTHITCQAWLEDQIDHGVILITGWSTTLRFWGVFQNEDPAAGSVVKPLDTIDLVDRFPTLSSSSLVSVHLVKVVNSNLYIAFNNGLIIKVTMSWSERSCRVELSWQLHTFTSAINIISIISSELIVVSSGYRYAFVRSVEGRMDEPMSLGQHNITGIAQLPAGHSLLSMTIHGKYPIITSRLLNREEIVASFLVTTLDGSITIIAQTIRGDTLIAGSFLIESRISSICIDPCSLMMYMLEWVAPLSTGSRETQLNLHLRRANSRLRCLPLRSSNSFNIYTDSNLSPDIQDKEIADIFMESFQRIVVDMDPRRVSLTHLIAFVYETGRRYHIKADLENESVRKSNKRFEIKKELVEEEVDTSDSEYEGRPAASSAAAVKEETITGHKKKLRGLYATRTINLIHKLRDYRLIRTAAMARLTLASVLFVAAALNASAQSSMDIQRHFASHEEELEAILRFYFDQAEIMARKVVLWQSFHAVLLGVYRLFQRPSEDFQSYQHALARVRQHITIANIISSLQSVIGSKKESRNWSPRERMTMSRYLDVLMTHFTDNEMIVTTVELFTTEGLARLDEIVSGGGEVVMHERCSACDQLVDFDPASPLQSLCLHCGEVIERCCYSLKLMTIHSEDDDDVDLEILQCPLCDSTAVDFSDDKRFAPASYSWLVNYESYRRCPFCTIIMVKV